MTLQPAAERAEAEKLFFGDRSRGQVEGVEQGRGMPLGEDQVVVQLILGLIEVVAKVLREEDSHQVGSRHRRSRMPRLPHVARANRIDTQLLAELAQVREGWR